MKIKGDFVIKEMAGSTVVIPVGAQVMDFNGMLKLNDTGAFLFSNLKTDTTYEVLVDKLLEEYDVTQEKAEQDVTAFVNKLKEADLIE